MTDASNINAVNQPLQLTIHPAQVPFLSGGDNTPSFKDFLDTINPLQHIPIVSDIYQSLTGDTPSNGAKIAGDTLFGGPIGLAASIFDTILQNQTGMGFAGNMMAALTGNTVPALQNNQETQLASNMPLGANQRAAYNAYVQTQNLTA